MEQELNEVKPLIPLLQKELAETKAAHERTQASTNETINGLLEELRTTEDTLSGERKKQGHDLEQYRYVFYYSCPALPCHYYYLHSPAYLSVSLAMTRILTFTLYPALPYNHIGTSSMQCLRT